MLLRIARKIAAKASAAERRLAFPTDFGTISIGNHRISHLAPLGRARHPGITKAGRLSFSGQCDGSKVKVFSVFSPQQAALRVALQRKTFAGCAFPDIVAADDALIAEAWVPGTTVSELAPTERQNAYVAVAAFLEDLRTRCDLADTARTFPTAFDYIGHYLVPRLEPWTALDDIRDALSDWREVYARIADAVPSHVSHPDLSANNIIREDETGRFVIIDNELLGVGHGWILDQRNSCLSTESGFEETWPDVTLLAEKAWQLRCIGSALDAGDLSGALAIARRETFRKASSI